jgi:23S rRNA pseudouridine2604 synthase
MTQPPADEGIRLSKHLADQGLASRREADAWIEAGWVRVDGVPAVLGQRLRPGQDVQIDPAARREQARRVTILLHKPIGYVSGQAEDNHQPAAVLVTAPCACRSTPVTRAAWPRPAGWTSTPPGCWC